MARESNGALEDRVLQLQLAGMLSGPVYCWDLDSTICDTAHRRPMVEEIKAGTFTWDDYAMLCIHDSPIASSVALMRELAGTHIGISGRSGCAQELTWQWFARHGVPVDALLLRKYGDHTPNGDYKVRVLRALKAQGADIRLFFEDWDEVARQIAAETGIPVVAINPLYPDEITKGEKGAF